MKLAEALAHRADLVTKINKLGERLNLNACLQEGTKANEDPRQLLELLNDSLVDYRILIQRINLTNATTSLDFADSRGTIMHRIAERDVAKMKFGIIDRLITAAQPKEDRYSHSEIL